MSRKNPPTNVARALSLIDEDAATSFREWARYRTLATIKARLDELRQEYAARGVELPAASLESISNWYQAQFPPGAMAAAVTLDMRQYAGVTADALNYAEFALVSTAQNLQLVQAQLHGQLYREEGIADPMPPREKEAREINALLYQAHNLAKELRTGAIALHEAKLLQDRRALEFSGGYRVAEILRTLARENNNLNLVEDLIHAALSQLETEVNGG